MDYFLIERSKKYISDFKERGKPFCFQTHFWGPHASAMPPKEVMDKYRDVEIPPSPSWEDSLVDKPRIHNLWRRHEKDWPYFQEFIRHYWAYMESIDTQIGRLLDFLKEENLYDNSWIIFTADHGDSQGCHRGLENKSIHMYEETTRIPLIVKAPAKYESGGRRNQPVGTCDIYATMLDIAGIDLTNDDGDGMSLVPLMKDQNAPWRDATVTECFGLSGISFSQKMIRSGSLKYVFNSGDIDELYDLDKDPYELHNCINDANRQEDLKAMRDKLCAWMEEHDDGDQGLWAFKQLTA
jgi:arylsulfatase A-like enzyme